MATRAIIYISAICWHRKLKFDGEILLWSKGNLCFWLPLKSVTMATKMISDVSVFMAYKAPIRWKSFVAMDNELPWQQEESSISPLSGGI